jgi:hypothetical protein
MQARTHLKWTWDLEFGIWDCRLGAEDFAPPRDFSGPSSAGAASVSANTP